MARLREKYQTEVLGELQRELGRKNPMSIPRLNKVVISMGLGKAIQGLSPQSSKHKAFEGFIAAIFVRRNEEIHAHSHLAPDTE